MACPFCDFSASSWDVPAETDHFWLVFDPNPVSPGHMLAASKRHLFGVHDLTSDEWADLHAALATARECIEKTNLAPVYEKFLTLPEISGNGTLCREALVHPRLGSKPDAYNHGVNDGPAAGRTIPHFHWHIIPRYQHDVEDPRGGVRHVIPEKGNYRTYFSKQYA